MDKKIGENIKKTRLSRNLTQEQLAQKCAISLSALNKYERNDRFPKYETIVKIAEALGVTANDLLCNPFGSRCRTYINNKELTYVIPKNNGDISEDDFISAAAICINFIANSEDYIMGPEYADIINKVERAIRKDILSLKKNIGQEIK